MLNDAPPPANVEVEVVVEMIEPTVKMFALPWNQRLADVVENELAKKVEGE